MSESRPKRSVRNRQPIVAEPEPAPVASTSGRRLKKAPIISSSSKSSKTLKSPKVPRSSPNKQTKVTTKTSRSPKIVASTKSTISPKKKQTKVTTKPSRSPKIVENSSNSTKVSTSSKLKSVPSVSSSSNSRTKPTKSSKESEKVLKKSSKEVTEKVLKKVPNGGRTKSKSQTNNGHNEEQDQDLMNSTFDILQGNSTGRKGRGGVTTNSKASKPSIVDKNSDQIDSIFAKLKGWKIQISEGENRLETMLKEANINLNEEQQQSKVADQKMPNQSNSVEVDEINRSDLSNKQLEALGFDLNYGIIDDVINKIDKLEKDEALSTTIDDHNRSQSSNHCIRKQIDSTIDLIWTERYYILGRNFPKNNDHDSVDEKADNAMKEEDNVIDDEISIDPIKYRQLYLQNVIEPLELELVDRLYFGVEMDNDDSALSNIDYKMDTYVRNPFQFYQLFLWKRLWMFRNRNFPSIIESFDQSHRTIRQQLDRYYRRLQLESSSSSFFDELFGELCQDRDDLDLDRQCFTVFYYYFRKNIDETLKIFDQDSHRPSRAEMIAVNLFLIQNNLVLFDLFHKILLNLLELKTSNSNGGGGGGSTGAYDEPISCCISLQFSNSKCFAIKSLLCLFNFLSKIDGNSCCRKFANYGEMISILEQFAETVLALVGDEHYQLFRQLFRQFPVVQHGLNLEQKLGQFSMFIKLLPQSTIQCYLPQVLAMICRLIIKKNGDGDDDKDGGGNMAVEIADDEEEEEEIQLITNLRDVYPLMQTVLMGKNQNNLMNSPNKSSSGISSTILDQLVKILYGGFSKFNNFDSHTPKMLDHFLSCHRQLTKETKEMVLLIKYKVSNELINN